MPGLIQVNTEKLNEILASSEIVEPKEPSEEYKKLVEEANERIREGRRKEAEAWIKAQNYIAFKYF